MSIHNSQSGSPEILFVRNMLGYNIKTRILFFSFQTHGYESYEHQLEDEQDLMGLYESELNKQILLRKRQKREWDSMLKKLAQQQQQKEKAKLEEEEKLEQERREEDLIEMDQTRVSKDLCSVMVKSALAKEAGTLQKVVDVLQNQNGKLIESVDLKKNIQRNLKRQMSIKSDN